ncbi:zinc-binding dehydrogenase [Cellulomonas humilata]|uniref:Zinc-binding dehydrogenase n=2 Tax=Cellulomonas humilata TaxID=144055 RepID=A0A7Y6A333_9CELL|nr:zinc-binding dehydrogenase [Cellulomonas humilata]NUU17777.1 zinc-binding dehydrogenase [Cellulomonas humilata]
MRAVVVDSPGGPEVLTVRDVPVPRAQPGQVLVRVHAFGLNRSELHFRRGQASFGSYPRIPGIEAAGVVQDAPGGELAPGTQVVTLMGGMGRTIDGGYAQYVLVPAAQVIPFTSDLPWDVLGAIPEMLQTAYGTLAVGVRPTAGQSLLVRGGTSSIGLTLAVLGKMQGLTVLSTTRSPARTALLDSVGVDHVLIDDGTIAPAVREPYPDGVDGAVELVGVNVMRDTLRAVRSGGTVCFTGMLSDQWTIPQFYPMDWLPNGVRLTAYSGEAADLPAPVLQDFLDAVADGRARVPVGKVYTLDEITQAHTDMEAGTTGGKGVVVL